MMFPTDSRRIRSCAWPRAKVIVPLMNIQIRPLEGRHVRLEPITANSLGDLRPELKAAIDCDPESWEIMSINGCGEGFADWWGAL
jgi:N-acetyltransferase